MAEMNEDKKFEYLIKVVAEFHIPIETDFEQPIYPSPQAFYSEEKVEELSTKYKEWRAKNIIPKVDRLLDSLGDFMGEKSDEDMEIAFLAGRYSVEEDS